MMLFVSRAVRCGVMAVGRFTLFLTAYRVPCVGRKEGKGVLPHIARTLTARGLGDKKSRRGNLRLFSDEK